MLPFATYGHAVDIGAPELLIVLVVILIAFGGKKLPDLARNLGKAKNELEKGMKGDDPQPAAQQKVAQQPVAATPEAPAPDAAPASVDEPATTPPTIG